MNVLSRVSIFILGNVVLLLRSPPLVIIRDFSIRTIDTEISSISANVTIAFNISLFNYFIVTQSIDKLIVSLENHSNVSHPYTSQYHDRN